MLHRPFLHPKAAATPADLSGRGTLSPRKFASGATAPLVGGECMQFQGGKRLQTRLAVGARDDPLEREADRVADQVLAGPATPALRSVSPLMQRFAQRPDAAAQTTTPASVNSVLASPGGALEPALGRDMAQRFGHDFSQVRVHCDEAAGQSAREVGAQAYTVGQHVVFAAGMFTPATPGGRRLLAHELTHVVQQSAGRMLLQRQPTQEIEAPELEAVPGGLPQVSPQAVDPRAHPDFIDRRVQAVGVGLSGTDFILFCDGIAQPVALPFGVIDLAATTGSPVSYEILPDREQALQRLPYGPPVAGQSQPWAFYRAVGGLIVPTTLSAASAPETVKLIRAVQEKLRALVKEVTDTLVLSVLTLAGAKLAQMGIKRWVLYRQGMRLQRLKQTQLEAMPAAKPAQPGGDTAPPRSATPLEGTAAKSSPNAQAGQQLSLFPELTDAAPSHPVVPQSAGRMSAQGRLPRIDVGEIKSVKSENAGWRQVNGRKFTQKIPDSGHEAVITYDQQGTVRAKVRISGGDERVIFNEAIGQVSPDRMPAAPYGSSEFGNAMESPIIDLLEQQSSTGQQFVRKLASTTGADVLPEQLETPVPH